MGLVSRVDHTSVWKAASRLKKRTHYPLVTPDGSVYSALYTVHRGVSDPGYTAKIEGVVSEYFSTPRDDLLLPFDTSDLVSSIGRLNRPTRPYRIGAPPLQYLSPEVINYLL